LEKLILTLHIIVCVVLVILVLLQSGKEGMGVIFGGGSSSLFGSTGAGGILVKLTTFVAVVFLITSLGYNIATSAKTTRQSTILDIPLDDPSAPARPSAPANATLPMPTQPSHSSPAASDPATSQEDKNSPSSMNAPSSTSQQQSSAPGNATTSGSGETSASPVEGTPTPSAVNATSGNATVQ